MNVKITGDPPRAPAAGFAPPDERRAAIGRLRHPSGVRALARNLALTALPLLFHPLRRWEVWDSA